MPKKIAIISFITLFVLLVLSLPFVFYLKVLPNAIKNPKTSEFVTKSLKDTLNVDLLIKNPVLKTEMSPRLEFKIDEFSMNKNNKNILSLKNLDTAISFAKIFERKIILEKMGSDYIYGNINELLQLSPSSQKEQKDFDWNVEWLDSDLYLKKCLFIYDIDKNTRTKITGQNIQITKTREPKFVRFNINIDIQKANKKVRLTVNDNDKVYIKDHKLFIDKGILAVNNSKVFIDAVSDKKNNFNLTVYSDKFDIKNAEELLRTNLVIPNGEEILAYFKDLKGNFDFKINLTNKDINGTVKLNTGALKIVPLNDLPIIAQEGKVEITNKKILLKDFKGYYGTSKANHVKLNGYVDDYTRSVDTNIEITGVGTNDLTQNYISKLVGCPLTLTGNSGAKIIVKSKYNKIDITWMLKIATGYDILVDGASLSPVNYDRALVGDMHLDGNILQIKSIKYFIAKELNKNTKNVKPILTIDGNMDINTLAIKDLGFNIPKPLPSEFLNVLIGQKMFKKGTISGNMHYINTGKTPQLNGKLEMKKVRIPSQRLSIKDGVLKTDKNYIHINAFGKFKKSNYKFSGNIVNSLVFPVIVKDINLTIDSVDIEKIMNSMNQQNTTAVAQSNAKISTNENNSQDENDDDTYTFDTGLLIVENCVLHVVKGFYKDIKFGNLFATLTLDKNGILEIKSNKFDFAEGISTLKVFCDLKKHKYSIRLGVKDINADLIAGTLLSLPKEITGKARGLIELYTDDSLKLNGRIRFDVQNGTIQKVGLVQYALNFASLFRNPLAMISPSTIIDLVNIPEGDFKKINGDIKIQNNVIENLNIKSSAPQLSSFIIGRYDLETGDATLRIYTKFSSKNKGFAGFMRNISLNSLANKVSMSSKNEANYYSAELAQIPALDDEKDCQIFLTKVDGDVEHFNFLSSLKKIK